MNKCIVCSSIESKKWYGKDDKTCCSCYLRGNAAKYYVNRRKKYAESAQIREDVRRRGKSYRERGYKCKHKKYSELSIDEKAKSYVRKKRHREKHAEDFRLQNKRLHARHYSKHREVYRAKSEAYRRTINGQYSWLKSGSKRRGLILELTINQYQCLRQLPCHYCQEPLEDTGTCLDRRDNNNPKYDLSNAVPCCHRCNYIKSNLLTEQEMLNVAKILAKPSLYQPLTPIALSVSQSDRRQTYTKIVKLVTKKAQQMVLTESDYFGLVNDPCYYCLGPLPPKGYALDRCDPTKGYTKENCVPCCKLCNDVKGDLLTSKETVLVMSVVARMRRQSLTRTPLVQPDAQLLGSL